MLPRTPEPEVMDCSEEATDYDQMDHSIVNQLFVDDLLTAIRRTAVQHSMGFPLRIVDLGTGTAQIPIRLLQTSSDCEHVLACDLSFEMLRLADRNIAAAGYADRIHSVFCDAKQLPFRRGSVQIAVSNSIIHHIPAPETVFSEVARCLSPGGLLFFRDLMRPDSAAEVDHLVETYAGNENANSQRMFRESLHAALTVAEVKDLLDHAGFDRNCVQQTSDRHWTVCCRKKESSAGG